MTEEEKELIAQLEELSRYCALKNLDREDNTFGEFVVTIQKIENLMQKQQEEIEHLKNLDKHQSKDIQKAVDYTFELNKELEQKNKMINEMAYEIANMRDKGFMASEIEQIINEFERKAEV